jgi:hypothetical protein
VLSPVGELLLATVWFTKSHTVLDIFFLLVLFIHFILDIEKVVLYPVKQLHYSFIKITQSLTYIALVRDCFLTGLLVSVVRC